MSEPAKKIIKKRRVPRRLYKNRVGTLFRGDYAITQAYEIGEKGILIESDRHLQEGSLLVISFHIDGSDLALVRGMVRYKKEIEGALPRFGIEFVNIGFDAKRMIRQYVASRPETEDRILNQSTEADSEEGSSNVF